MSDFATTGASVVSTRKKTTNNTTPSSSPHLRPFLAAVGHQESLSPSIKVLNPNDQSGYFMGTGDKEMKEDHPLAPPASLYHPMASVPTFQEADEARKQNATTTTTTTTTTKLSQAMQPTSNSTAHQRVTSRLSVSSLLNPIEAEAETAILSAIESREVAFQKEKSNRAILRSLTEKEMEAMQPEIKKDNDDISDDHEVKTPELAIPKTDQPRDGVGTTLFALASVMRTIHNKANTEEEATPDNNNNKKVPTTETVTGHNRLASKDIGRPTATLDGVPQTEADLLATHAALLLQDTESEQDRYLDPLINNGNKGRNDGATFQDDETSDEDIEEGIKGKKKKKKGKKRLMVDSVYKNAKEDWKVVKSYIAPWKRPMTAYVKFVILFLILPAVGVSALLFYALDNPLLKKGGASISWFIIFLCVRQVVTFTFAKLIEIIIIDILAVKSRLMIRVFGPLLTLMVLQSRGWPHVLFWWSFLNLLMLTGGHEFANHWLFYQDLIGLFNEDNPAGTITANVWNYRCLFAAIGFSVVASVKRFLVGLYLGSRTFKKYGSKLASVIHRMIIISQISRYARQLERQGGDGPKTSRIPTSENLFAWKFKGFDGTTVKYEDDADDDELDDELDESNGMIKGEPTSGKMGERTHSSARIAHFVEAWEEPAETQDSDQVSIQAILQFKQTLAFMDLSYPFSSAFGLADKRENCIESSQDVYRCLLLGNKPSDEPDVLQFKTLETLMRDEDEALDETRLKDLVRVFRPDRQGRLTLQDFVRSVDRVYKDLRLLRASIHNSSQIDAAFEVIINTLVYFITLCIILAAWGIDPLSLFLSLSSLLVAFAFAIGNASAKYFEGLLFILGRDPYDIGDRISVNDVTEGPSLDGVFTWYVEKVTLYFTTLRLGATNEVATISNSSLASSRIINANRSPKAMIYVILKFPIDVPYTKVQLFMKTIETFVKARPREWIGFLGMRATRVEADLAFIEYIISLQHRESWQMIGAILQNKADVISYCLEVQKQLGMRYVAPSTPVDLSLRTPGNEMRAAFAAATQSQSDSP